HTAGGPFILTLYERRVDKDDLPFFLGLMDHLAQKGISCPLPVRRNDGEVICCIAGRSAALITFLEGMWMRNPDVSHCRQVGQALAEMHLAARDFPLLRENALSPAGWARLWEGCKDRSDEVMEGLAAEVGRDFDEIVGAWPSDLPSGVIHADL